MDSDDDSVSSTASLPIQDTETINKFIEAINTYKKAIYNKFPNDESGPSQTNDAFNSREYTLKCDALILLGDESNCDTLTDEATTYLLPFISREVNFNELININSLLRSNLINYPNSLNVKHVDELKKNNQ